MFEYGPYELFNRDHRGWLVSRFWRQKPVLKHDIARVLENDPDAMSEPIVVELVNAKKNGTLFRKRGRNPYNFGQMANVLLAQGDIKLLAAEIRHERSKRPAGAKKERGELSPTHQAAEQVARAYNMGSGASLLRRISFQRKNCPYFCD